MRTSLVVSALFALLAGGCMPQDGEKGPVTDTFGDPQVMGLAVVLCDHQVQVAQGALDRGLTLPDVQGYATEMIATQAAARDRLLDVARAQGIAVDESTEEARAHVTDTREDLALLQPPTSGAQVDDTYLGDSVHDIDKAITIWDNTLLPLAGNAALRDELAAIRPTLVDTLARGQALAGQHGITPKSE